MIKNLRLLSIVLYTCFVFTSGLFAQKISTGSDWNNPNHWSPVGVPSSSDDVIIDTDITVPISGSPFEVNKISYSHNQTNTLTVDGQLDVVGTSPEFDNTGGGGQFGQLTVSAGGTLYFGNGTNPVILSGASPTGVLVEGTFKIDANPAGSNIIPATWGDNSSCRVIGVTNAAGKVIGNLNQGFNDLIYNCPNQIGLMEFLGTLALVDNDLVLESTGSGSLVLNSGGVSNYSLSVGNDLIIKDGSAAIFSLGANSPATLSVGRNFEWYNDINSSSTIITDGHDASVTVLGDVVISGGNDNIFDFATSTVPGSLSSVLEVGGNLNHLSGIISVDNGAANAIIRFLGAPSIFDNSGAVSKSADNVNFEVPDNVTLEIEGNSAIISTGNFILKSGATLNVKNASGLDNSTGIIQTTTKTYEGGSNFVYNGAIAQLLGNGFPSGEQVNLEIDNILGVSNNVFVGVADLELKDLTLTLGQFDIGSTKNLVIEGDLLNGGGLLNSNFNGGKGTSSLTLTGSGTTVGSILFNQSNGNHLYNLTIDRSGTIFLGNDLIIDGPSNAGILKLESTLDITGTTFRLFGAKIGSGKFASTSASGTSLVFEGSGDVGGQIEFDGTALLDDIIVTRVPSDGRVTFGAGAVVNGTLYLNQGELNLQAPIVVADGATINVGAGTWGGTANPSFPGSPGSYNIIYSAINTTGKEVIDDSSTEYMTAINDVTINSVVTANKSFFVNGNITSTSTLNASGHTISLNGTTVLSGANMNFGNLTITSSAAVTGSSSEISVDGDWNNLGGTYNPNGGIVRFSNSGLQNIDADGQPFNTVIFNGTGTKTLTGNMTVLGALQIQSGATLDGGNSTIGIGGTWQNSGVFVPGTSTVIFDSNGDQDVDAQGGAFHNLTFAGGSGVKTILSSLTTNNDLSIETGATLKVNGPAISVGRSWINHGTLDAVTGFITFKGNPGATISGSQNTVFNNITFDGDVEGVDDFEVKGQWNSVSGDFVGTNQTISFSGSGAINTSIGSTFSGIRITGDRFTTTDIVLNGDFTIHGAGLFSSSGKVTFGGSVQSLTSSGFIFNALQFNPGTSITVSSGAVINAQNLIAEGTLVMPITIQSSTSGTEAFFSKSSGIVDGKHLILKDIHGIGGATFNAKNSTDLGNNDGWVFTTNSPPTNITLSSSTVDEELPVNTKVGNLNTVDPDGGDTHSYSLVSGVGDDDNASFKIVGNKLRTLEIFDFETKSTYTVRIQTDDGNGGLFEKQFAITVNDVVENIPPTDISLTSSEISEGLTIGTVVGDLSTTDADASDVHTYLLIAGTGDVDNGSFTISGDQLLSGEVFDFETKASYSIRVQTNDGTSGTFEKVFTISINDVVENDPPTDIGLSNATVDEGLPSGTDIGVLSTTDANPADVHTYSLVPGTGDTDNASFTISGDQLLTAEVFSFETKSSYSIRVNTNDGHAGNFEREFTITVNDVEENGAPTAINISNSVIDEGLASGSEIGIFSTTDVDAGDTHTYALAAGVGDEDNGSFSISGDQLLSAEIFDFETKSLYSIRISSSDGTDIIETEFSITVADLNEAPTEIILTNNAIDEGQDLGTLIGNFLSDDPNPDDTHDYELVGGNGDGDNGFFTIADDELLSGAQFDFDDKATYSIRVQSSDNNGGTVEQSFTINVVETLDTPTSIEELFDSKLTIYPNPTQGRVHIDFAQPGDDSYFTLSDLSGKTILVKKIESDVTELDLSSINNGVYLLEVRNKKSRKTFRLIKK